MTHLTSPLLLRPTSPSRTRRAVAALAVAAGLALAGCSASSEPAASTAAGDTAAAPELAAAPQAEPTQAGPAEGRALAGAGKANRSAAEPVQPMLAKKASVSIEVPDVADAAERVRGVAAAHDGIIVVESIGSGEGGRTPREPDSEPFGGHGTLTVSVPAASLDATLADLAKVGTVVARGSNSTDVTSHVVDTDSRIRTMSASVDRVRALMRQARDVSQIVELESELSRRQADLESLESQRDALKGRVEQATIAVSLSTATHAKTEEAGGFAAGLKAGWDAFVSSGRGLLTGVGAVLPFAVLVGLVAVPVAAWLRRRRVAAQTSG
jgi:hypothetical protein